MKISVIIPAYNEEKFIEKTLSRVYKQDYPNFEVIVVDNNSTDKTNEIAKKFGLNQSEGLVDRTGKPVLGAKVFFEEKKGTGPARERGRREASGEILAFLDADCLPEEDWLSRGVKHFENNENIVAVTGPYDYFDSPKTYRKFSIIFQRYVYSFFNFLLQRLHKGGVLIFGNCFIRAKTAEDFGGFNTEITFYGDDTDTAKRLAKKGKIIFDKNLLIKGSSRRLQKEGLIKIPLMYFFYFFKVSLFQPNKKINLIWWKSND